MRPPTRFDRLLAPDWVCEVLSPSTSAIDRAEKMPIYVRERVATLWLIDARTLEALVLEGTRWSVLGTWPDDAKVRVEPFVTFLVVMRALAA